jgi:hypothetical protein
VLAIKALYKNDNKYTPAELLCHWHLQINGNNPVPSAHAIKTRIRTFEERAQLMKTSGKIIICTPENIQTVKAALE